MTRKKDGKTLFEVMGPGESRSDKSLEVPSWFNHGRRKASPAGGQSPGEAPSVPQPVPLSSGPARDAAHPKVRRNPIMSVSAGRLIISLNQISAVVVVLAIILLGVAAYMLGRRTSQDVSASPDRIQALRNSDVTRLGDGSVKVLPVPGSPPPRQDGSGMISDDAPRQKGCSYLVIQGGVQTLKEAGDIKKFLYDKGINATVHRMNHTQGYMVRDMKGFQDMRSEQTRAAVKEHVTQIERLGKMYQRQGGRYDFKQGGGGTEPWMITEK